MLVKFKWSILVNYNTVVINDAQSYVFFENNMAK